MEEGWKNIYSTSEEYLITIAKDQLNNCGMGSVVINHKDTAYVFFGEYELYVKEEDVAQATKILEQLIKG